MLCAPAQAIHRARVGLSSPENCLGRASFPREAGGHAPPRTHVRGVEQAPVLGNGQSEQSPLRLMLRTKRLDSSAPSGRPSRRGYRGRSSEGHLALAPGIAERRGGASGSPGPPEGSIALGPSRHVLSTGPRCRCGLRGSSGVRAPYLRKPGSFGATDEQREHTGSVSPRATGWSSGADGRSPLELLSPSPSQRLKHLELQV
jgi:hypothetical protein